MFFSNNKTGEKILFAAYLLTFFVAAFAAVKLFVQAAEDSSDTTYKADMKDNFTNYLPVLPDKLDFCGERVPLEYFDVRESLERELIKTMYWHSETFLYLKRANRYFPVMKKILKENGVPEDFIYLCVTESGMSNVVSPAKAVGFWQLLEATGKENGLEITSEVDERYDVEKSTVAACKYLKQAYVKFGNWTMVAAAYNCGQAGAQRLIKNQGETSYYDLKHNTETGRYVYRILAYKLLLSHPEDYGFVFREKDLYPVLKTETIEIDSTINDLYSFGKQVTGTYKMLKLLNPWLRDTKLTNTKGTVYKITVLKEGARENTY
ncbi:MAG: lytic transglycosylase domain-containing protein [Bacteroidales bacterium]|nr:lytic transglycosylase domain-containing protein [Bacteroidales bacterium]